MRLSSLRQPFKKALQTAARLGASGIEIDLRNELRIKDLSRTAIRHLRKTLDDLDLRICCASYPTRSGFQESSRLEQRIEATKEAMSVAYQLGATCVSNQVGILPEDQEAAEWSMISDALTTIGQHGQRVGTLFAARTGAEPGERLKMLIDRIPAGSMGIDFDPAELIVNRFSASEAIKDLAEYVLHLRARDGVQDLALGRGVEVQLGRGSVDFPEILGSLENYDFNGFITLDRAKPESPEVEMMQGVEFLQNLWG